LPDPCASIYCSAGRACVINNKGVGECNCVEACEVETDPRRRVSGWKTHRGKRIENQAKNFNKLQLSELTKMRN